MQIFHMQNKTNLVDLLTDKINKCIYFKKYVHFAKTLILTLEILFICFSISEVISKCDILSCDNISPLTFL